MWGIVYEFLRVATHPQVFAKPWQAPLALLFMKSILASPGVGVLTGTVRRVDADGRLATTFRP